MESKKKLSYTEAWKRNVRALKIWRKLCPGAFLLKIFGSIFEALNPYVTIWLSAQLINELAGACDSRQLFKWVILQLSLGAIFALIKGVLSCWSDYEYDNIGRVDERMYMEKMRSLDYADMDCQYVFDLYSRIMQTQTWDGWGIRRTWWFFERMIVFTVQIIGGVGLTFSLFTSQVTSGSNLVFLNHPVFAVVMIVLMLLVAVIVPVCNNMGLQYYIRHTEQNKMLNRYFDFYCYMNKDRKRAADLRMYRQQENVCSVYMERGNNVAPDSDIARYAKGPMGLWLVLAQCISVILMGIFYLFVCLKAWGGAFGAGAVIQYVGASTNLFMGIYGLLELLGLMYVNGDFLGPCFEFMDIPNKMYQGSLTTEKRSDGQYEVEFKDVSFKYPGSEQWALRHVNIKFQVGRRLAVVGMNGSGKTTFIKLMCRLYDPVEGQILLNGIDIRKYRYDDYIDIFSVVFQDYKLLALPLGENVAGAVEYDGEHAMKCLQDAGFDECMSTMPKGLETYLYKDLDKEGVEVSGGEAQKIAIARALYKNAPFIILDEPTAALDPIVEAEIYSKFNDIVGDRTAIYISHRLSSCIFCDEIVVFHEGTIIQQGMHTELLADKRGKYYELWGAQARYYTEKGV